MANQTDVLIIGGGFAGVATAQTLAKGGVSTLLIDKKDYFEVTYSTLRSFANPLQTKNQARKKYQDFLSGQFKQGAIKQLDKQKATLEDGSVYYFKKAIIASGTSYPTMSLAKSHHALTLQDRNKEMLSLHEQLLKTKSVLVIGGGVVGVELAGEIAAAMPKINITLSHSGPSLLNGFKQKTQTTAQKQLKQLGVNLEFNTRYKKNAQGKYIDQNSKESTAELVLEAVGAKANNAFLQQSLKHILNDSGFVKIDNNLKVIGENNLYALGDIADVGEAKLGYLANEQGTI